MKIYCTRKYNDPIEEFDAYIKQICDKDAWIAVRVEDLYTFWVSAINDNGTIKYYLQSNSVYCPYAIFIEEVSDKRRYATKENWLIDCDWIKVRKPVEILTTEELADIVSNPDDVYNFHPEEEDDE